MADRELQVDVKLTSSDRSGATLAKKDIQEITDAAKTSGVEGVKAQTAVNAATEKTFTSKKQLKDAVKGLSGEFPVLARLAQIALNPIVLITAAIASAFAIWKKRVDDLSTSLGGIEMPDVSETQIERIKRTSEAWGELAAKTGAFSASIAKLKGDTEAVIKLIEFNESFRKALGIEAPGQSEQEKAGALSNQAAAMEAEGRAMVARAGTPGSKSAEAALGEKFESAAKKAVTDKAGAESRLAEILAFRSGEMNPLEQAKFGAEYAFRYGTTMTGGDAAALERANIAQQQGIIDRAKEFSMTTGDRAGRRAQIEAGQGMISDAGKLRGQVEDLLRSALVNVTSDLSNRATLAGNRASASAASGDILGAVQATMDMGKQFAALAQQIIAVKNENAKVVQRLNNLPK